MRRSHAVDANLSDEFKRRIAIAHDSLADIVDTMVTMQYYLVRGHIRNGFGIVREAEEILMGTFSSEPSQVK